MRIFHLILLVLDFFSVFAQSLYAPLNSLNSQFVLVIKLTTDCVQLDPWFPEPDMT